MNSLWILQCLLCLVLLDNTIRGIGGARRNRGAKRPYVDPECPRKPDLAQERVCFKKCHSDVDCKGRFKKCLCDDVCGKSCVKPTKRCERLKDIPNGKVDITRFNTFGAKARYTCNEGYVLSGRSERVCQGDGRWSGAPPLCDTEGVCGSPPAVPHASHDRLSEQKVFPLGTKLSYTCENGYHSYHGFVRAMCIQEGRWVGPTMTCSPRRCENPGDTPNGDRQGNIFHYPSRVTYACHTGYEMIGRPYRVCQANGQWSGTVPICKPVKCPPLSKPVNGDKFGEDNKFGAIVNFNCSQGFTLIGSRKRRCDQGGMWSGKEATCALVDCGKPKPLYNGFLDGQRTTYGAVIEYRCFRWTKFSGTIPNTTCLENGQWSNPDVHCMANCRIPKVEHGNPFSEGLEYKDHGLKLDWSCNENTHQKFNSSKAECYNGTWSFMPKCVPMDCAGRPPVILDGSGMVRYYSNKHGSKAKYKCYTGYEREGDEYLVCQYGKWKGTQPYCKEVFCKYPGTIDDGDIMLVGAIGKYEYRHYVRNIGHTEQIEFHCNKGFKRVGPKGATCVHKEWSPPQKAKCVPGQHPKLLQIFRGKRSADQVEEADESQDTHYTEDEYCQVPPVHFGAIRDHLSGSYVVPGTTLDVRCDAGYKLPSSISNHKARCHNGAWTDMVRCVPGKWLRHAAGKCHHPKPLRNGHIHLVTVESRHILPYYYKRLYHGTEIEYTCLHGYQLNGAASAVCNNGSWSPGVEPTCTLMTADSSSPKDDGGREMGYCEVPFIANAIVYPETGYYVSHGTTLHMRCTTDYRATTDEPPVCEDGLWTLMPECVLHNITETSPGS